MEKIIVVDFGGQYAHLIASKIRRLGVFSEIRNPENLLEGLDDVRGIILSGGPASVYEKGAPEIDKKIFELGIPILGICYGHQLIAQNLGGKVERGKLGEYGKTILQVRKPEFILSRLREKEIVWMSHQDYISRLPKGFKSLAFTKIFPNSAIANWERKIFGVQFHPEVTHTPQGLKILDNFLKICRAKRNWDTTRFLEEILPKIREKVAKRNVFLLASGGVDSTVALALLIKALGSKKVFAFYVDSGLQRKNERQEIERSLKRIGARNLKIIDAKSQFLKALKRTVSPEEKREIIGNLFVSIWRDELQKISSRPRDWILAQGTIYPDTIETARTKFASRIKTHHNRVEAVKNLIKTGDLIEPLEELYKDEVRQVGEILGLPEDIVWRHPFPGPGLAIRVLCSGSNFLPKDFISLLEKFPLFGAEKVCQRYCLNFLPLPIKTVGVQGDQRTYNFVLAVQGKSNWKLLGEASTKLTDILNGYTNRVVHLIFPEDSDLRKLKLKEAYLDKKRLKLCQEIDWRIKEILQKRKIWQKIWQCPIVLLPLSFSGKGESIVLRPVLSENAMTAEFFPMPKKILQKIIKVIISISHDPKFQNLPKIEAIFYDITNKPPGTIEWE